MAAAELNAYPDPHLRPDWQRLLIHICLSAIFLLLSWLMLTEMVLSLVGTLAFKGSGWPDMTLQKQTWPSRSENGRDLYHLKEKRSFWIKTECLPCFPNPIEITAEI